MDRFLRYFEKGLFGKYTFKSDLQKRIQDLKTNSIFKTQENNFQKIKNGYLDQESMNMEIIQ